MIDDALREYAEMPDLFSPTDAVTRDDDGRICILQGTVWASISAPRFDEHELDDVIAHVHAVVPPEKRQTWWIGPSARPARLVELLLDRGFFFAPDGAEVRAMALTSPPPPAPAEVEVRLVETFDDFLISRDVQWDAFQIPEERREQQRPHLRSEFDDSIKYGSPAAFLAYLDGKPAATALAIPSSRGVFLIAGSTASWARGRGAYRALVRARWDYAVERGTPALVTEAMVDTSFPILHRLGFTEVCTIQRLEETRAAQSGTTEPDS